MTELQQAAAAAPRPDPLSPPEGSAAPLHHTSDQLSHSHHRPAPGAAQPAAKPAAKPARPPSKPRLAGLVFLFVYPLVTVLLYLVRPLMQGQPIYLTTLVVVPVVVGAMVWGIIPFITGKLRHLL